MLIVYMQISGTQQAILDQVRPLEEKAKPVLSRLQTKKSKHLQEWEGVR